MKRRINMLHLYLSTSTLGIARLASFFTPINTTVKNFPTIKRRIGEGLSQNKIQESNSNINRNKNRRGGLPNSFNREPISPPTFPLLSHSSAHKTKYDSSNNLPVETRNKESQFKFQTPPPTFLSKEITDRLNPTQKSNTPPIPAFYEEHHDQPSVVKADIAKQLRHKQQNYQQKEKEEIEELPKIPLEQDLDHDRTIYRIQLHNIPITEEESILFVLPNTNALELILTSSDTQKDGRSLLKQETITLEIYSRILNKRRQRDSIILKNLDRLKENNSSCDDINLNPIFGDLIETPNMVTCLHSLNFNLLNSEGNQYESGLAGIHDKVIIKLGIIQHGLHKIEVKILLTQESDSNYTVDWNLGIERAMVAVENRKFKAKGFVSELHFYKLKDNAELKCS